MALRTTLSLICAALCAVGPALAQEDLSVDEILQRLDRQKELLNQLETGDLGETRGLKLVTVEGVAAEPAAGQTAAETQATTQASTETATQATTQAETQDSVSVTAETDPGPVDPNKPIKAAADASQPLDYGVFTPELQVNLQIRFGFDSAALADSEKPNLDKMCQVLRQSEIGVFRIVGHTDTAGSEEYNQRLSMLRAKEVARYLVEDCGIAASRLQTVGMGERFPFNTANPRADENRRVEFQAMS